MHACDATAGRKWKLCFNRPHSCGAWLTHVDMFCTTTVWLFGCRCFAEAPYSMATYDRVMQYQRRQVSASLCCHLSCL